MSVLPSSQSSSLLDFVDDVSPNVKAELRNRYDELSRLEQEQLQMGTVVPQLYGSLSRFIANPSTISCETFKRMLDTDETIGSGIDFLNLALIARFGDYQHPVKEIEQFVRRALSQMEGSWHENLDEMFSAEWAGFSATEQVWTYKSNFDGAPAFVPEKLVTYPPLTIVFAVNRHGQVLPDGVYQYQRFHNTFFNSYLGVRNTELDGFRPDLFASIGDMPYPIRIAADLTYLTVKIPKDKTILLRSSSTGKFSNPYGRSILRRAYKNWVMKDAFLNMWIVAADRKGTPLVIGYAAPNDTVMAQTQGNGMMADQSLGRADIAMSQIFKTIHNSSFIVLPGRKGEVYDVEAIQVQGDMNVFKDGIDYFNKAIMRSLLIPPLVMTGGDGAGSYALGQEHHKIFAQVVDGKLKVYKQGILDQFVSKIIAYNFPKHQWEKHGYGEFILEEYDPEVMERLSNIYRNLTETGYMSPQEKDDLEYVREKMGIKKNDKNEETHTEDNKLGDDENLDIIGDESIEVQGQAPATGGIDIGKTASMSLNGAQVTSLVEVVAQVSSGMISHESGVAIIMAAFRLPKETAEEIIGTPTEKAQNVPAPTETAPANPQEMTKKVPPRKKRAVSTDPGKSEGSEPIKNNPQDSEDHLPPNYHV